MPEIIFCLNVGNQNNANYSSPEAANPACLALYNDPSQTFAEIDNLANATITGIDNLIIPAQEPNDFTSAGGTHDTRCHRFNPNGRLKFAYQNSYPADNKKYFYSVACGYDYNPLGRKDDGTLSYFIITQDQGKQPFNLTFTSPVGPVQANTSQQFLLTQYRYKSLEQKENTLNYTIAPGKTEPWDGANSPSQPYMRPRGFAQSTYIHVINANLVGQWPNKANVHIDELKPSFTWWDVLGAVGGFVSIPLTIFTLLFGARRSDAFGLLHRLQKKKLNLMIEQTYTLPKFIPTQPAEEDPSVAIAVQNSMSETKSPQDDFRLNPYVHPPEVPPPPTPEERCKMLEERVVQLEAVQRFIEDFYVTKIE
ncbi:hypothetical protein HDV00_000093 [Rhizophlyctis rosea]|nr:hypothetical protein HDV00_000093 [Rhizophlyctis rosea]